MKEEPEHSATSDILSKSRIYRDYHDAFSKATGLPLTLDAPGANAFHLRKVPKSAPFCALMAKSNVSCAACYALQQRLEESAQLEPRTLKCFAGLCETAVPVRVGHKLVAFLHTGHVLIDRPDKAKFSRISKELLSLGTDIDLKQAEEAWFATRVLTRDQYESMVRLLTVFAQHLGLCGSQLVLKQKQKEPLSVKRAREIINLQYQDELSLGMIAAKVNVSAGYFSDIFKKATGINFVEYVARVRIEKAKNMLQKPDVRISEVAFEVGFQSLSQFNRAFKKYAGMTPSELREESAVF
ncbi:helix-turn-helix domain-containing protein [Haloferula sp.]|uniref:helix-turn-helix domain-containing protein n=1 Tax=Haloferula sp. TaxID=2497595 RepID=UPI003C740213